jgi:plastocyanin
MNPYLTTFLAPMKSMKTFQLLPALLVAVTVSTATSAQNTYSLVASDFQFGPPLLTINAGDTVRISLNAGHSFREVSQATWELNVGSPGIGWDFPTATELTLHDLVTTVPGTIYYVCVPHVNMGMKGRIIVAEGTIDVEENTRLNHHLQPNPTTGLVSLSGTLPGATRVRVVDPTGRVCLDEAFASDRSFDLGSLTPGHYGLLVLDKNEQVIARDGIDLQQ